MNFSLHQSATECKLLHYWGFTHIDHFLKLSIFLPFQLDRYSEFIHHMNITGDKWLASNFRPVIFYTAYDQLYV